MFCAPCGVFLSNYLVLDNSSKFLVFNHKHFFRLISLFAVRAGTGGDEAGIWAGDLVGTCFSVL